MEDLRCFLCPESLFILCEQRKVYSGLFELRKILGEEVGLGLHKIWERM